MASQLPTRDNLATSRYGNGLPRGHLARPTFGTSSVVQTELASVRSARIRANVAVAILAWIIVELVMR